MGGGMGSRTPRVTLTSSSPRSPSGVQHGGFNEQLADKPSAAGPDGHANGHLHTVKAPIRPRQSPSGHNARAFKSVIDQHCPRRLQ